jgi:hypothetical protein
MGKALFTAKSKAGLIEFSNKREIYNWLLENDNKPLLVSIERTTGVRTFAQNNALHKFFEILADSLNDAGLTVQMILQKKMELNWTPSMVKEILWRSAQKALFNKESTADLDKVSEIDQIYEHLVRHLGEKFSLEVPPFPNDPHN